MEAPGFEKIIGEKNLALQGRIVVPGETIIPGDPISVGVKSPAF